MAELEIGLAKNRVLCVESRYRVLLTTQVNMLLAHYWGQSNYWDSHSYDTKKIVTIRFQSKDRQTKKQESLQGFRNAVFYHTQRG